ncbi:MAG TPA: hypothetical protein PKV15_09315 [Syntrophomonadaceae bacterium]|nr:hypothetical protein [Syntrophomonadaceae bacterium]HRX21909.1 hypothetical protein [Syntrophomonadaceae bacterium]
MSFPIIPDIKPDIKLDHKQVVDMLLASIAQEEKGLAHIINVEGEKLKFILGKLQCPCAGEAELESLKEMNREVRRTLQTVLKSQMLLQVKLEDVMEMVPPVPRPQPVPRPPIPQPALFPRPFKIVLPTVRVKAEKSRAPKRRKVIKVVERAKLKEVEE